MYNKFLAWAFGRTQVSNFAKKSLIVNFKKSANKKVKIYNLTSYEEISFKILKTKETETLYPNHYELIMETINQQDGSREDKVLAYFAQETHATKALLKLQNDMYQRPVWNIVMSILKVLIIFFVLYVIVSYIGYTLKTQSASTAVSTAQMTNEQIQALNQQQQEKIQQMQAAAAQQLNNQGPQGQGPGILVPIPDKSQPAQQAAPAVNFSSGSETASGVLGALN